jgi:hypothetical protein
MYGMRELVADLVAASGGASSQHMDGKWKIDQGIGSAQSNEPEVDIKFWLADKL